LIDKTSLARFLSGRALGLFVLLGFQVVVVRRLSSAAYADYALVMALAALMQTMTSFGIPRVVAKVVSGAGVIVTRRAARRLAVRLLGVRLLACVLLLAPAVLAFPAFSGAANASWPLLGVGAVYALAAAVQMDVDGLALALNLQSLSRRAAVGEPLARLALVSALSFGGGALDDAAVLAISAVTALGASTGLLGGVLKALARGDDAPGAANSVDESEVRRIALGGYAGTLSWLAFSPAVVRVIASQVLPVEAFAGFSFLQTLVVSAQRYAPSFTLFPLLEPAAIADAARTGRLDRLRAALSLLVKIDGIAIGAAIVGAAVAGAPVVLFLTHGRYGEAAPLLPWLLVGIIANASHRSYEIAALGVGAPGVLTRALGLTVVWLLMAILTAPRLGVWPLLLCPLGDAVTRFWLVQRRLDRRGLSDLLDIARLVLITGAAGIMSIAGATAAAAFQAGLVGRLGVAAIAVLGFLGAVFALRPLRKAEIQLLTPMAPWLTRRWGGDVGKAGRPLGVLILTPRGRGGTGGVDRLMDSLRPLLAARSDVRARFITTRGSSLWVSPIVGMAAAVRVSAACILGGVDVIHVNLGAQGGCYRKMALLAVPRLLKTPYVLHLHGSAFERFWHEAPARARRRIDHLFRDAAQVVVLGEVWRRLVIERVPNAASRIFVLPNAVGPIERRRPMDDGVVHILFLGELGVRKGSPVLIEALARVTAKAPWRATLAGDGDVGATRRSLSRLGLSDRAKAPGWVGPAQVDALLATADILALPSFEENLPMAVVEAFAAGLAVIATPVGAVPDLLLPGETGLMVSPGDVAGLAEALTALIDDDDLLRRLGAAARAFHAEHLALTPYVDRLVAIWADSAASHIPLKASIVI
jgi:glycosyltransferase involved in cell wall biosynthesis/O-antigen/teichoic acid export membrane protein